MRPGFTIVELLIVIVVIGILAAITVVAYSGIQGRATNSKKLSHIQSVAKAVELYYAQTGEYPVTSSTTGNVRTDSMCSVGTRTADWVPGLVPTYMASLPQSDGKQANGTNTGCYKYWSNGTYYVLSVWVGVEGGPQTAAMYRRLGFREASFGAADQYYCNHTSMGGISTGTYNIAWDLYKISYTLTSPTAPNNTLNGPCNEAPPVGA